MSSKVELVRLVLKDVLRVQITEAEAEKVLARIEALHEKEAVEHSVQRMATPEPVCTCRVTAESYSNCDKHGNRHR